jgi:hypothetical protein
VMWCDPRTARWWNGRGDGGYPTWRCEHVAEGVGDHGGLLVHDEFEALGADELDNACGVVVVLLLLGLVVLTRRRHPATCDGLNWDWGWCGLLCWFGLTRSGLGWSYRSSDEGNPRMYRYDNLLFFYKNSRVLSRQWVL